MKQFTSTKGKAMTMNYATQSINMLYAPAERHSAQFKPASATDVIFYSWWRADRSADLAPLPGLDVQIAENYQLLADLARLDLTEVLTRVRNRHRPYIARLDGAVVAYGWSAMRHASIGELGLEFAIPANNRYLWDFATLPAWRGLGIYPRLLHAIVRRESVEAARFWIGHVNGNYASQRGIVKAGFGLAGATEQRDGRALTFSATGSAARALACAELLGLGMSMPLH
jgi:GNAT superfamily N-acetyltransferase